MLALRYYSVFSPKFEVTSGGVRVMYGLYGWLLAKGQVAFMNQYVPNSDHVAIYPEIYPADNPSNANKFVRYVLQKPATVSAIAEDGSSSLGPTEFPKSEDVYAFSKMYYDGLPNHKYMFLPILNMHLFRDEKKKRTKTAYFVGKGDNLHLHPESAKEITRDFAQDQTALKDLLNKCEVLYSYDFASALTEIARLCGCRVILAQDMFSKKDYKKYEPGLSGVSFGEDKGVKLNSDDFRWHYRDLVKTFSDKLDRFIEDTQ